MKVLYVEDNPANVFLVKRVAKMGQHEIINYIDGNQALSKFDTIQPDLVLMDIQLAGDKSGLDVVRELRSRGVQTPIIAVTAYAMVGDKERCLEAGCTDYLPKPLPIPRLVDIFKTYSEAAAAKSATAQTTPETSATTTPETTPPTHPVDAIDHVTTKPDIDDDATLPMKPETIAALNNTPEKDKPKTDADNTQPTSDVENVIKSETITAPNTDTQSTEPVNAAPSPQVEEKNT